MVGRVEAAGTIFEIKRHANGSSNSPGDDDNSIRTLHIRSNQMMTFTTGSISSMVDVQPWVGVSNPTNFSHAVHVGFDPQTGQFVGLPPEWSKLLNSSAITKEDYERNPQAVFEVLDFYSDLTKRAENPQQYSSLTPTPPPGSQGNKQLGYNAGGASVAPPRPLPPQQKSGYGNALTQQQNVPPRPAPPESPTQQRQQMQGMAPNYVPPDASREEQRLRLERQRGDRRAE